MKTLNRALLLFLYVITTQALAHSDHQHAKPTPTVKKAAMATYLGNEGVMIDSGSSKVLFDPFFHNDFGHYQLVPDKVRKAILNGQKPYDNIAAIFISHAHEDHFSAVDMRLFLTAHPKAKLVAPQQAVDALAKLPDTAGIMSQAVAVSLEYGDKPWVYKLGDLAIEAVRIPHSGWPSRASIENIVFRVTLSDKVTIMHMGDADANDKHFKRYQAHWQQRVTDTSFPPYWFLLSPPGLQILDQRINAKQHIGVHVPIRVPSQLAGGQHLYFSVPQEKRALQ